MKSDDLRHLLDDVSRSAPATPLDVDAVVARGRRAHRARRTAVVLSAVLALGSGALGTYLVTHDEGDRRTQVAGQFDDADRRCLEVATASAGERGEAAPDRGRGVLGVAGARIDAVLVTDASGTTWACAGTADGTAVSYARPVPTATTALQVPVEDLSIAGVAASNIDPSLPGEVWFGGGVLPADVLKVTFLFSDGVAQDAEIRDGHWLLLREVEAPPTDRGLTVRVRLRTAEGDLPVKPLEDVTLVCNVANLGGC